MSQQNHLNPCAEPEPADVVADKPPTNCDPDSPNFKGVAGRPEFGWKTRESLDKTGYGAGGICDPMQTGQITNDPCDPDRTTVYRYTKALRGCDEAMKDLFSGVVVEDDAGKYHRVPVVYGTQERAVAAILQSNVRKDNSLVVDRLRLPLLAVVATTRSFNRSRWVYHQALDYVYGFDPRGIPGFSQKERYETDTVFGVARGLPVDIGYTLTAWTLSIEDMNQIFEQVALKFSPIAYIRVRGVGWEIGVNLDSTASNLDLEPGDKNQRVIKYEFNMTAETYIPQPIRRRKTVLRTRVEILDGLTEADSSGVVARLEEAVKEIQ